MDYATALQQYNENKKKYQEAITNGFSRKELTRASGRLVASLQTLRKVAAKNGMNLDQINSDLRTALDTHKKHLMHLDKENKNGQRYSIITELSIGFSSLINSINKRTIASTDDQKKEANQDVLNSIGQNLKNIVKAPLALTTRVLKTGIVGTVLFAPVSLGLGILHAAWECMDTKKSPYEGKTAKTLSQGFTKVMTSLNNKVQRI